MSIVDYFPETNLSLIEFSDYVRNVIDGAWFTGESSKHGTVENEDAVVFLFYDDDLHCFLELSKSERMDLILKLGFTPFLGIVLDPYTSYTGSNKLAGDLAESFRQKWGGGLLERKNPR